MIFVTRQVRSFSLWLKRMGYTVSASLTSLLIMKPSILMYTKPISHTMMSMQKMSISSLCLNK
ncbi:hypothetical protein RHGRI_018765 [Rhododendron griersonianum]|uniref:Uncharacterized protein n=1 Tax=Rhododendron griersonianum TaxID=479676 RepID=A0AAV6K2M9_9ERIC|nr:hypothetical protein RHGRI_018765 [Rhododendron griersonianum]